MASNSTGDSTGSDSGEGGIVEFFMQPIGMALLGGFAIVAGYFII
mgnify:CR=1 FL=1